MIKKIDIFTLTITISTILFSCNKGIKVNDEFTIEYMEMFSSISLRNEMQGFVPNVTEAYWNKDSLVVSGNTGCFLIIFKKTEYNDEMEKIDCNDLKKKLKTEPTKKFFSK
ncbi:hypothetical protein [Aquimarina celericrescens]|uniref:Lipoprotein n=1 Tax=Aquimarina celericrescens TaxID=1964542 RepID=A0ABW5B1S3_9FLAO|nr:hypothetical protein [Aquimarina celericrescens]